RPLRGRRRWLTKHRSSSMAEVSDNYQRLSVVRRERGRVGAEAPWHLKSLNAPNDLDGSGIVVGMVDSGIALTLPDHTNPPDAGGSGFGRLDLAACHSDPSHCRFAASSRIVDLDTRRKHGSAVAAFLAGSISGVSPAVFLRLAAVDPESASSAAVVRLALEWLRSRPNHSGCARAIGCDVINLSLATTEPGVFESDLLQLIIDLRDNDKPLVVAGTGDAGMALQCPGAYDCLVSVGEVNNANLIADSSGSGTNPSGVDRPDLCAPGYGVAHPTQTGMSGNLFGTSFSTPMVAGAAALIMQRFPAYRFDPIQVRSLLLGMTRPVAGVQAP